MSNATAKRSDKSAKQETDPSVPSCRYIRSLELENVRTFRSKSKLDCCFPDGRVAQWTVILGENGTGKTTLLQYIAGMLPVQDTKVMAPPTKGMPKGFYPFKPLIAESDYLMWNFDNLSHPRDLPRKLSAHVELSRAASSLKDASHESSENAFGRYGLTASFSITKEKQFQAQVQYVMHKNVRLNNEIVLYGYGAGRHVAGPGSPYLSSDRVDDMPVGTIFRDDVPLVSPEQWLLGLDHQSKESTALGKAMAAALARAKERLCSILPDVNGITIRPHGTPQPRMTVFFETPYGPVRFAGLSLGYRAMTAWIIDLVRHMHMRYPHLAEPEKGPAVVLIDEFDLHMHVRWQMEMIDWLSASFPNTQFIITAHSPLVVQGANGRANIAVLKRVRAKDGKDEVVIENDPQHVSGWRLDQLVTSDLFGLASSRSKEYAELMRLRKELLQKDKLDAREQKSLKELNDRLKHEAPPNLNGAQEWLRDQIDSFGRRPSSKRKPRK